MHPFGFIDNSLRRPYQYLEKFLIAVQSCSSISLRILLLVESFLFASVINASTRTLCKFHRYFGEFYSVMTSIGFLTIRRLRGFNPCPMFELMSVRVPIVILTGGILVLFLSIWELLGGVFELLDTMFFL